MDYQPEVQGYDPNRPKIVIVPHYFFILKCIQIALSFLVLALTGASIGLLNGYYVGGPGYSIFVCIATMFISAWYLFSSTRAPNLYHKIPVLVLEIFQFLWWLSSWTSLAYWAAWVGTWYSLIDDRDVTDTAFVGVLGAAATFAAFNWVLFTITMIVYIINMQKHGRAAANSHNIHVQHATPNKMEMQPQGQPGYGVQQPQPHVQQY